MAILDRCGNELAVYDLVAIEALPDSCFWTVEFEPDSDVRDWHNRRTRECLGKYGLISYWHDQVENPRWHYESVDELSVSVRTAGGLGEPPLVDWPLALKPGCVRRIPASVLMMFPYGSFSLSALHASESLDDVKCTSITLARKILTTPLEQLEILSQKFSVDKMFIGSI
jgi:hypothetical protein